MTRRIDDMRQRGADERQGKPTMSDVSRMPGSLKDAFDSARQKTKAARASVDDAGQGMSSMLHELANAARDYVRANPNRALSIALGVGFFYGLTRARHRR
jgi:ElaB/YqjD/DUF883 family membrane-anchored ribosome-binding protein